MPQKIAQIIKGEIYHVFNRGVDKRVVFSDVEDYLRFYQSLNLFNSILPVVNFDSAQVQAKNNSPNIEPLVDIIAYSLLPNHYHLLIKSLSDNGLSEFMRRINSGYTSYFNQKYDRTGALFQGLFKRCHVKTPEQYNYLFAYINENHYVHNIPRDTQIYLSSSYHYQNKIKSKLIKQVGEDGYRFIENKKFAEHIYRERQRLKLEKLFFE